MVPSASPIYPRASMLASRVLLPPNSSTIISMAPSTLIILTIPTTKARNPSTPAITPAAPPASVAAADIITIAALNEIKSKDILPTVSMEVLKPHAVSTADIPTTSALSAATRPYITHT